MFNKKKKNVKSQLNIDTSEEITPISTQMRVVSPSHQQYMSKKIINATEPVKKEPEVFKWCSCHIKRSVRGKKPDQCYDNCPDNKSWGCRVCKANRAYR